MKSRPMSRVKGCFWGFSLAQRRELGYTQYIMKISKQKNTSISYDIYHGINDSILTSIRKKFKNVDHNINDIISPIKISRYENKVGYVYFALLLPEYDTYENIVWKQTHAFVRDDYILFIDEDEWG